MRKIYKRKASEVAHSVPSERYKSGNMDRASVQEFDESCFVRLAAFSPSEIKQLRRSLGLSQEEFAGHLNISQCTVDNWETGATRPKGMAVGLLSTVQKHGLEVLL